MREHESALPSSLRVIEIGGGVASYTAHNLADLGAEVIKVEPAGGDADRSRPTFGSLLKPGLSAQFVFFNANKRSVVLDLATKEGAEGIRALARTADAIVDASGPDTLTKIGCGPNDLLALNPSLVVLSQTPFGLTGARRSYLGANPVAEAASGFLYPLGDRDHPPIPSKNDFLYQLAGLQGSAYILAALRAVRAGAPGQFIEMSLQEVGTHMQGGILGFGLNKTIQRRSRFGYISAMQMHIPVKDGMVLVQPVFPAMWKAFTEWVANPELEKPEYATADLRLKVQPQLEEVILPWAKQFTVEQFVAESQSRRVPSSPVNPPAALLKSEHAKVLGSFITMRHPDLGEFQAAGAPVRLSKTPMTFRSPAPNVGEHQEDVTKAASAPATPAPSAKKAAAPTAPLAGIRVLDFTHVLAGPTATQVLGFLGAEVIKVETKSTQPDPRQPQFASINRAKKSITLDARSPEGHELAIELAKKADVVIDNFSAGVMGRLGLAYEDLVKVKPDIIAVSINGWGRGGPLSSWSAYGPTLQSYTGMYWVWRQEGAPLHQGMKQPPADFICAAQALMGIMGALTHRDRTGEGQFVELVMLEGLAHSLGPFYLEAAMTGKDPDLRSLRYAPGGCYPCKDDDTWCVIACDGDEQWSGLKAALGNPAWASDAKLGTPEGRRDAWQELDARIAEWTRTRTPAQAMEELQSHGVAAAAVENAEDLFNDPHLRARKHIVSTLNLVTGTPLEVEGMTARFGSAATFDSAPPPQIGQHNGEIFGGLLGLSPERIKALEDAKVIY